MGEPGPGRAAGVPYTPPVVNKWLITIAVMAGTFMEIIDTTVVNVALPHMAGGLSASTDEATWVLTSYLVSNAIVLPITGWLAARFGRKRFLMFCLILFTVSSVLCGAAPTLGSLIFFRVLQGIGGGALQPISQAILLETFPPQERGMAMALWGIGVVIAPIVGPILGGWITDHYSWRWVFYINLPIGILSLIMTGLFIFDPAYLKQMRAGRIDGIGLTLLVIGLGALQIVLDKGEREDWFASDFILRLTVAAVVALGLLIYWELKTKDPVVDLRLFKEKTFAAGVWIMFFFGFALYGSITLLPLYLQVLMGYDATLAGLVLAPGGLGSLLVMPLVGRLTMVMDNRLLIGAGLVINGIAVYMMSQFTTTIDFWTAMWPRFIQGVGLGMTFVSLTTVTMARVSQERMGNATGIFNLLRNLGGSFGIATMVTLLSRRGQFHQARLVEHFSPEAPRFQEWAARSSELASSLGMPETAAPMYSLAGLYREIQRQAQMIAFCENYWILTILFGLLLLLILFMKRDAHRVG